MENMYDVIIVGAGPAGISAAIYAARAKFRVLVLEKSEIGGQITITSDIVNYPGVRLAGGRELTENMRRQAESFGAEFMIGEVLYMELEEDIKILHTTKGEFSALGVILAVGANPRKLGFVGEKEFAGRGVAYCATCDGEFFTGKDVFVIGGGFAAVEEGIFLTKYAKSVTLIVREEDFTCAKTVSDQIKNYDNIKPVFETEIVEVGGKDTLSYAVFNNNANGKQWRYEAPEGNTFGVFIFAGYVPNTAWLPATIECDKQGYIVTDINRMTSVKGVYAAGDVCVKNLRQVVTAVSDGAIAATALEKHVEGVRERLGIPVLYRTPVGSNSYIKAQKVKNSDDTDKPSIEFSVGNEFINQDIRDKLKEIFDKFERVVHIRAWLDDTPLSGEMKGFLNELTGLTDKVQWEQVLSEEGKALTEKHELIYPAMEILKDNVSCGIFFHGVPGGHEFNSFIIALYNIGTEGQAVEEDTMNLIKAIKNPINIKILVSLSCTMCPETVMSAQSIALHSENVTAEMFDLSHFPQLKEKYKVMSVPCTVVNDSKIIFGKKNLRELTELIS